MKELREKAIELIKTSRGFRGREGYFAEQLETLFRTATLDEVEELLEYTHASAKTKQAIDNLRGSDEAM